MFFCFCFCFFFWFNLLDDTNRTKRAQHNDNFIHLSIKIQWIYMEKNANKNDEKNKFKNVYKRLIRQENGFSCDDVIPSILGILLY